VLVVGGVPPVGKLNVGGVGAGGVTVGGIIAGATGVVTATREAPGENVVLSLGLNLTFANLTLRARLDIGARPPAAGSTPSSHVPHSYTESTKADVLLYSSPGSAVANEEVPSKHMAVISRILSRKNMALSFKSSVFLAFMNFGFILCIIRATLKFKYVFQ
jgi:hypothetical protein